MEQEKRMPKKQPTVTKKILAELTMAKDSLKMAEKLSGDSKFKNLHPIEAEEIGSLFSFVESSKILVEKAICSLTKIMYLGKLTG